MVIDPSHWTTMAPFASGDTRTIANNQPVGTVSATGESITNTQGAQQAQQNPYDWLQGFLERERYNQREADRQYQIQLKTLDSQKQQIAIQRGQAEATAWYNQQLVLLSQQKLAEDKRQFDTTTQEAVRQFGIKQEELKRQFDITTVEGRRQFDIASGESKRQFDATFGQRATQFQQDLDFRKQQLGEGGRQFDLTRGDQLDQFAKTYGLDVQKVREQARQFDLTRADQREQFLANLAENHAQFQQTSTGYTASGAPTLEREKFGNQALLDWTSKAIDLASNPADWIKYKQMTSGVAGNVADIPGLDWTQGGQQGNTAFEGEPQANSLQRVLGQMGIQQPIPGGPAPGQSGAPPPDGIAAAEALTPAEQSRYNEIVSRRAALREAGEPDVSAEDQRELAGYEARLPRTLTPGEQSRLTQLTDRAAQLKAAGEPGLSATDAYELQRYQQRVGVAGPGGGTAPHGPIDQTGAPIGAGAGGLDLSQLRAQQGDQQGSWTTGADGRMVFVPGTGGAGTNAAAAAPPAAGANAQPVTNWAYQAANMVPQVSQLNLSAPERQIYDTANAFSKNPQQAASGFYEQLDPMTRELMRGAAQAQGHDWTTVMSRYNRSRWGGSGGAMAA